MPNAGLFVHAVIIELIRNLEGGIGWKNKREGWIGILEFGEGGSIKVVLCLSLTKEAFKLFRATYSCIV